MPSTPVDGIRSYQSSDRLQVLRIAADTAYFGGPVENFLEDRRLFWDVFYAYYLDFEPQHAWVSSKGASTTGFLVGSVNKAFQKTIMNRKIVPAVIRRALTGRYKIGPLTRKYAWSGLQASLRHELPQIDRQAFPAHLHINVEAGQRGKGSGRGLMLAFLEQLKSLGIPGVYLNTTSLNQAACRLYESLGFDLVDARPTRLWCHWVGQIIENRCYALSLAAP